MRKIIASIDIGSDNVKLVVGELFENRLHILSAVKTRAKGLKKGRITDEASLVSSIKEAIFSTSENLGVKVSKCVLVVNMSGARVNKAAAAIKTQNGRITSNDVVKVMNKCADGKVPNDYCLVSVLPVEFTIDGDVSTARPVGMQSENLGLKAIVTSAPKAYVGDFLKVVNEAGLKVLDVVPSCVCDYYAFKTKENFKKTGVVLNLGYELCTVSCFDKGVLTGVETFKNGGQNVIGDISYIAKIDTKDAGAIYKDIVLASSKLANPNEYRLVIDTEGKEVKLNQYEMSEIAASRIKEILNLAKKQINILTKKEISYIIVTGGLSEMRDFNYALASEFGKNVVVNKLALVGARDNSYSSAVGAILLFTERLEMKGKAVSIFSSEDLEEMQGDGKEVNTKENSLLGKVFGYFFDN